MPSGQPGFYYNGGLHLEIHLYNRQSPGKWSTLLLILLNIHICTQNDAGAKVDSISIKSHLLGARAPRVLLRTEFGLTCALLVSFTTTRISY